ncbi:alpha-glucosidase [Thermotoga sp. Ku-13t]|uniref:alpha-glucosidase n=1 Tax=Thermotoga sp. Ku-13t TaxID=1755813 RepID=UPI0013E9D31C|nr:alpha-glucosidase [Thermotoga sp. Ku-13t]KAF2957292.1 alpha-glucosidase [Thermotoga sp. Ku-13t]
MNIETSSAGFRAKYKDLMLEHTFERPLIHYGRGIATYHMSHGNFRIEDELFCKYPAKRFSVNENVVLFDETIKMSLTEKDGKLHVRFEPLRNDFNRLWFRLPASENEFVYGCGEQYSHFNLRGRKLPIWVSEQGVGRNKKDLITLFVDWAYDAGGDWYTTYYPQPVFVSSKGYFCIVNGSSYMEFDFRKPDVFEVCVWQMPIEIILYRSDDWSGLFGKLSELLGTQPVLPEWVLDGAILGIQGGTKTMLEKIEKMSKNGLKIAGVWIQDWEGKRVTSFGKQLMWNWVYSEELYPNLSKTIEDLHSQRIRVLGYINPFLALEGSLYREASEKNYLVKRSNGQEYHIVVTTFPAAIVDVTKPEAFEWLKGIIKSNMIGIGLSGWMADYGEYLPTDAVLSSGEPAETFHNRFPVEWARLNYEAVKESERSDLVFFMRSGYLNSSRFTPLYWHGDQLVNWSVDDGIASVIPAKLSLSMCAVSQIHSDIGGYTTLAKNVPEMIRTVRTKELFMRWTELSVFEPVMRTHEGNWPDENWQFDSDEETIKHFVEMTDLHVKLKNYFLACLKEYQQKGLPLFRPLFLHYPHEERCWTEQYEFLFGRDILVAPVLKPNVDRWQVYLPQDEWIHYWSGKLLRGGVHEVEAPIGRPPFFIRAGSEMKW